MDSFEHALAVSLSELGYSPIRDRINRRWADFESADGKTFIEIKKVLASVRDLHAATSQLAIGCRQKSRHAVLVLWRPKMSREGLQREWQDLMSVVQPEVARRLQLLAVWDKTTLALPDASADANDIEKCIRKAVGGLSATVPRTDTSFEVFKILLVRWLLAEEPIAIKDLQSQAGLSYPTVAKALVQLDDYLDRSSARSVSLRTFPKSIWNQLLALSPRVRQTIAFEDRSGKPLDANRFVERLARGQSDNVAVGGVLSARHWDPEFNLDGTPRIDLCLQCTKRMDLEFLQQVDPALRRVTKTTVAPVLVVHAVPRVASLFTAGQSGRLSFADPVETLLDLNEMRLFEQADAMVRHLRSYK